MPDATLPVIGGTMQTAAPLEQLSLQATNRPARELARLALSGDMELAAPYQRSSVWTARQRINLVRSWATRIPVPAVVINNRGTNDWTGERSFYCSVVDGKQRIETAVAWFDGKLAVPSSWFEAGACLTVVATGDGDYVTFDGLHETQQRRFSNWAQLPVLEAQLPTVAAEAELYELINTGGTAQTDDDLARASAIARRA